MVPWSFNSTHQAASAREFSTPRSSSKLFLRTEGINSVLWGTHCSNSDENELSPKERSDLARHRTGLFRETRGGERLAFEEIVDRYGNDLFRLSVSMVRNREDAEDLLQETFLAAYEGQGRFAGRSSLKTWLIGILLRKVAR